MPVCRANRTSPGLDQLREGLAQKEITRYNGFPILDAGQTNMRADILARP